MIKLLDILKEIKINKPGNVWDLSKPGNNFDKIKLGDILSFNLNITRKGIEKVQQKVIKIHPLNDDMLITRDLHKVGKPETEGGWDYWTKKEIETYYNKPASNLEELKINKPSFYKYRKGQKVKFNWGDEIAGTILDIRRNKEEVKNNPIKSDYEYSINTDDLSVDDNPWYLVKFIYSDGNRRRKGGQINAFRNYEDRRNEVIYWVPEEDIDPIGDEYRWEFDDPFVPFDGEDKEFNRQRGKKKRYWDVDDFSDLDYNIDEVIINKPMKFPYEPSMKSKFVKWVDTNGTVKQKDIDSRENVDIYANYILDIIKNQNVKDAIQFYRHYVNIKFSGFRMWLKLREIPQAEEFIRITNLG